jgi:hypothetical protein
MSYMKIELRFTEKSFSAIANLSFDNSAEKEFSFILNKDLCISAINCNNKNVIWENRGEITPIFRSPSQTINIWSNEAIQTVSIEYSGVAYGWHNVISDKIKALNWYSVWYPQELSINVKHDEITIYDSSDYFIVKGVYEESNRIWRYGDKGYDPYNIIAYKRNSLCIAESSNLNIYYVDEKIKDITDKVIPIYNDIYNYYNLELFETKEINCVDVACLYPEVINGGAYKRKDLIVCDTLGENDLEICSINAHELAHEWCNGAICDSWEDWLNETTAEWSSLLYALDRNRNDLFDFILQRHLDSYTKYPTIKTFDGKRPEGVHTKGTVLFYEIYIKYGLDTVKKLVKIFTQIDKKTTIALQDAVRAEISSEVADFIEFGVNS